MVDNAAAGVRSALVVTLLCAALAIGWSSRAFGEDPETAADREWITLTGTVVSTAPESFRLDYGGGVITVEMDHADWYNEGRNSIANDRVVVYGRVDEDAFQRRTIEAGSVYVESLGTYFYASGADERDLALWSVSTPLVVGDVEVVGTVASIEGRELTLQSGIRIDSIELGYNPIDDIQQLDVGDRIKAGGHVEGDIFKPTDLMADWITNLSGS